VSGLEHLPLDGGGVLVAWHPNGMIDPGLIFAWFPKHVVFGARDGLFRVPVLGQVMKAVGTVPIFRAQDADDDDPVARRAANTRSLAVLAERVAGGAWTCLFPEGDSHDQPHLLQLRTGTARFWDQARALLPDDAPPPAIVPVGLHYDQKNAFRSRVLLSFHPPVTLPADLQAPPSPDATTEQLRRRHRRLTAVVADGLSSAIQPAETWEKHHLMHRLRKLVRAERARRAGAPLGRPAMSERQLGFARVWAAYETRRRSHPDQVDALFLKVREYDADLRALLLEDHELDGTPRASRSFIAAATVGQVLVVYGLLPPLLLLGYAVNLPVVITLGVLSRVFAHRKKDEASVKLLGGLLMLPLGWALSGFVAWRAHELAAVAFAPLPAAIVAAGPVGAAITTILLSVIGGMVALRYVRLSRETAHAVRVRLTRARQRATVRDLRRVRAHLFDVLMDFTADLDLPGHVAADGRVVEENDPRASQEGGLSRR